MIAERPPLPRLRLSSIDPPEVTPRLLAADGAQRRCSARTCTCRCRPAHDARPAPHAPALRRGAGCATSSAEIRALLPDAALGTDVIAGFPGESEADFAADAGAARRACRSPTSTSSPTRGAAARRRRRRRDHVPPPTIIARARRDAARARRRRSARAFAERFVGTTAAGAGRDDARPRQRPAGRLQPQLRARPARRAGRAGRTARCGARRAGARGRSRARASGWRRRCGHDAVDGRVRRSRSASATRFRDPRCSRRR